MDNRIKNALGTVHAEEALKQNTKAFLKGKLYQEEKNFQKNRCTKSKRLMAAACLAVFVLGGYFAYFQSVSAISIDINPSIELSINRFDKVISVKGYNEDGIWLAEQLDVYFMNYTEAVDAILEDEIVEEYLQREEQMEVTVLGNNEVKSKEMLVGVNACVTGHQHKNVHCHIGNREEAEVAHEHGLSFGKYQKFLSLQQLDPSITLEEAKGLTMREINQWIWELSQDEEMEKNLPLDSGEDKEKNSDDGNSGNDIGKDCENGFGSGHHSHGNGHH